MARTFQRLRTQNAEAFMANESGAPSVGGSRSESRGPHLVDRVRDTATTRLSNEKNRATDGLGTVAQAVRQTTQQLRDQNHDTIARYAEQAADQIERLSERLRTKDVEELMRDLQSLTRRQPALFVGGAFALGLIGARFFKSSSRQQSQKWRDSGDGRMGESSYEYRGYAQVSGPVGYGAGQPSTVHDYGTTSTEAGEADMGDASEENIPGEESGSDSSTSSRSRRRSRTQRT
jgi:hypothetical protein